MATEKFKQTVKPLFQNHYKYYRLCYSVVAASGLFYILYYHFTISSWLLWQPYAAEKIISVILAIAGLTVMLICIRKYFFDLSGIDALLQRQHAVNLKIDGLNRYVRHPLYAGTILFVWGFFLWQPLLSNLISCTCMLLYTLVGTHYEEQRLLKIFGNEYKTYAARVPMLLPHLL